MRLPGRGYESINKLHSDIYGRYGALDRMKILADIAPWSDEYKLWRDVAKKTIVDTSGKKEIEAIKKRVEKQSKGHDFYKYKFLNNPTEIKRATISSIEGTSIKTIDGKMFNLAGIKLSNKESLNSYLQEGTHVNIEYLKRDKNNKGPIDAAIFVNGMNINQTLLQSKQATKVYDGSPMSAKALTGQMSQLYGATMEAIGHAPIPFIHNKLLRIDTPIDSYKNERVYGTPYSTWDHPIKGFIEPALHKTWSRDIVGQGIGLGAWYLAEKMWQNPSKVQNIAKFLGKDLSETGSNKLASVIFNTLNPGAFVGSMIGAVPTGLMSGEGIKGLLNLDVFGAGVKTGLGRNAARLGAVAMIAGYGYTRADNPFKSTAIFSVAGVALSKQLQHKNFGTKEGAIAGAAFGLFLSSLKNPHFDKEKMFGKYIPESTKKRWDIEEYYDRLEYIKYKGLYEKASRKAKIHEGTDVKKIINKYEAQKEYNENKIKKIDKRIQKVSNSYLDDIRKKELIKKLTTEKNSLSQSEIILRGGKYTKAAVAYKEAYESTIYGLNKNSTISQVMRALPKADKDFFMEFIKEKDQKERKKILKYISPYQKKALQIAWGEENIDDTKDNKSYFKKHFLPGVFWSGWSPQVDLENVKIKTIENEGMLLSDFGIYESQKSDAATMYSPEINNINDNKNGIAMQSRLQSALNGLGLIGVKVTVSPSSSNGIEVLANITNAAKITEYKIRNEINKVTGFRMFY